MRAEDVPFPRLRWEHEGRDWPLREHSRFLRIGPVHWHVQVLGQGTPAMLLHGTGASGHSFRALAPLLAEKFTLVIPDLPGQGFSQICQDFVPSLHGISTQLSALLSALSLSPQLAVGHSAGAAVLARMTLDAHIAPQRLIGLCAALLPLRGAAMWMMPAARYLAGSRVAAQLLARQAQHGDSVARLVASTGSRLDARELDLYRRLAQNPAHVAAVLSMLAAWDLEPLFADLPRLATPLLLLAGSQDRAIPLWQQQQVQSRIPGCQLAVFRGAGHLLHEEQPQPVAQAILQAVTPSPASPMPSGSGGQPA